MVRKSSFIIVLLPLLLAATALHNSALAAAGSLDPSFGQSGQVLTRLSNCGLSICNANPADAVLQSDGKIVVAETLQTAFGAIRYLPDDQHVAEPGEDRRTVDKACTVLLALAGRESSHAAAICGDAG